MVDHVQRRGPHGLVAGVRVLVPAALFLLVLSAALSAEEARTPAAGGPLPPSSGTGSGPGPGTGETESAPTPPAAPMLPAPPGSAAPAPSAPAPAPATPPPAATTPGTLGGAPGGMTLMRTSVPAPPRFTFNIPPRTPIKNLLPLAPKGGKPAGPVLSDDLAKVPEVAFEEPPAKGAVKEASKHAAFTIARINHINARQADGYMKALLAERSDLSGLPFAMGDSCRTKGEHSKQFARAVATVRAALQRPQPAVSQPAPPPPPAPAFAPTVVPAPAPATPPAATPAAATQSLSVSSDTFFVSLEADRSTASNFWETYRQACEAEDAELSRADKGARERVALARIAALMQILAPEPAEVRLGLVKYLTAVPHVEATRALARLALFAPEEGVREAALESLKVRRERDYTDILVSGLRYPWPAVAKRAAAAMVKLERQDLIPQLVGVLDEPDQRLPKVEEVSKRRVPVVRELVRINHHRNCVLCHAPGNTGKVSPDAVSAEVPVPDQPLPSPMEGYRNSTPDLLVRVDVTYLRQDFSILQPVADAHPWPEMQRFDFLVRKRVLSEDEAALYRKKLDTREPGVLSPYHRAALAALRDLTGKDTEPTAAAWRKLLKLPAPG